MNKIIPLTNALVPQETIGGVFHMYLQKLKGEDKYYTDPHVLIKPKYRLHLTMINNLRKDCVVDINNIVNVLTNNETWQKSAEFRLPDKYTAKVEEVPKSKFYYFYKVRSMKTRLDALKLRILHIPKSSKIHSQIEHEINKAEYYLKTIEFVFLYKLSFCEQAIAFMEQKKYPTKIITFLREYTKTKGESVDDYINNWCKRLMEDAGMYVAPEDKIKEKQCQQIAHKKYLEKRKMLPSVGLRKQYKNSKPESAV